MIQVRKVQQEPELPGLMALQDRKDLLEMRDLLGLLGLRDLLGLQG